VYISTPSSSRKKIVSAVLEDDDDGLRINGWKVFIDDRNFYFFSSISIFMDFISHIWIVYDKIKGVFLSRSLYSE
jgi:hypothetical protein